MIISVLALGFTACNDDDAPAANPLVGSWNVTNNMTITLSLNGEPVSYTVFGNTVFGLSEEESEAYVTEWLQNQVLGPIQANARIEFRADNQFVVGTPGMQSSQGTFQVMNDGAVLRLTASGLPLSSYEFDVLSTACPALKLRHSATIEILGAPQQYPYTVELELAKSGC